MYKSLALRSRQAKLKLFLQVIHPSTEELLLFLGAGVEYDPLLRRRLDTKVEGVFVEGVGNVSRIMLADVDLVALQAARQRWANIICVCCDGRSLPFPDNSIPVVFSNATVEHVGPRQDQERFAKEVCRVGRRWFVTTPNFYFPFEFHYRLPFIHYCPRPMQKSLKKHIGGRYPRGQMARVWLLTPRAMRELFPNGHIVLNRVTVLPETIIAWGAE